MKICEPNEIKQQKRAKNQSTSVRNKTPSLINFEFKSSLFTEKNKSLIEKLISQNISQETSFSKEEEKNIFQKPKPKTKKAFSTIKSKIPKSLNTSLLENKSKRNIKKTEKELSTKNILTSKNNSTIIIKNKDNITTKINEEIKPIHKKIIKISKKQGPNIQSKIHIQTIKKSLEKKKIVFNGITKDLMNKNKTRNNPIKQPKQNSNLTSSIKSIIPKKKIGEKNYVNNKNKITNKKNLRNSMDNKYNNLNLITVNTINVKERKKSTGINNIYLKTKNNIKSNNNNLISSPKYRRTINYK
jgi:hypothetical protein